MLKILLGDDHAIVRRGLRQVLTEEFGQVAIGEVGSGHAVVDAVREQEWDVVVLDINLPDKNGVEVLKEVKRLRPSILVVMLTMHPEEQYAMRTLKAGAAGYLTKESAPEELITAIRKVLRGGKYVSASLAERLASELAAGTEAALHQKLSDREYQVLLGIARGNTVTETAEALSLSVKTISTYRARLLKKMKLQTTVELVRYALAHRLVD